MVHAARFAVTAFLHVSGSVRLGPYAGLLIALSDCAFKLPGENADYVKAKIN